MPPSTHQAENPQPHAARATSSPSPEAAEADLRARLASAPDDVEALNDLGNALKAAGKVAAAETCYRDAIARRPNFAVALNNLGNLLRQQGRLEEGIAHLRAAVAAWPEQADIQNNLGVALHDALDYAGAEAALHKALRCHAQHIEALNNLGNLHKDLRRPQQALAAYRKVLQLQPEHPDARWNLALLHLQRGDYRNGWPLYESRHDPRRQTAEVFLPPVNTPMWRGESLAGKHLLIWHEQGMGDEIQFARFIPQLRARFAVDRITLFCKSPLQRLLRRIPGVDHCLPLGAPIPAHDCWTLPGSLPGRFDCMPGSIPDQLPYLDVPAEIQTRWRQRLPANGRLRVGLVWSGSRWHKNDRHRSLPDLALLAPLWQIPDIDFYCLHKQAADDPAEQQARLPPIGQPLSHLGPEIDDFLDSAAILQQLDLLISVDTAIVHLAGALARPAWVMLPWHGCDWRWLEHAEDSVWYPGCLRLFRQGPDEAWSGVIDRLAKALARWRVERLMLRGRIAALSPADRDALRLAVDRLSLQKNDISPGSSPPPTASP